MMRLPLSLCLTMALGGCLQPPTLNPTDEDMAAAPDMPSTGQDMRGDMSSGADMPSNVDMSPDASCIPRTPDNCSLRQRFAANPIDDGCGNMITCPALDITPTTRFEVGVEGFVPFRLQMQPIYQMHPTQGMGNNSLCDEEEPIWTYTGDDKYVAHMVMQGVTPRMAFDALEPMPTGTTGTLKLTCGGFEREWQITTTLPSVASVGDDSNRPRIWLRTENYTRMNWPNAGASTEPDNEDFRVYPNGLNNLPTKDSTNPGAPRILLNDMPGGSNRNVQGFSRFSRITLGTTHTIFFVLFPQSDIPTMSLLTPNPTDQGNLIQLLSSNANTTLRYQATPKANETTAYFFTPMEAPLEGVYVVRREGQDLQAGHNDEQLLGWLGSGNKAMTDTNVTLENTANEYYFQRIGVFDEGSPDQAFRGAIGDLLIYEGALSDDEVGQVSRYLQRRFAID